MGQKRSPFASLPPIGQLLQHSEITPYLSKIDHEFVVHCLQAETDRVRLRLGAGEKDNALSREALTTDIVSNVVAMICRLLAPSLKPAVNGTGIILHTGLGRAPMSVEAQENVARVISGYCNLEFDLESGKRGQRNEHVEEILCQLTGAEAACVVNNNAAAVLLTLNSLAFGREAIVSRGQLVEIGGSFRIPEVMEKSGTRMVEVGTTNKTHLRDYTRAVSDETGVICVIHTSNYRVQGFTKEVPLAEIVELAHEKRIPVMQDLGSGVLIDFKALGLPYEPLAKESIASGADVVTFSGDKVLGGPQCGIIVGKKAYIDKITSNALMRALRCDKLTYAALEPTLKQYLQPGRLLERNRVLKMLLEPLDKVSQRAEALLQSLTALVGNDYNLSIEDSFVQIGSGALPLEQLPSKAIGVSVESVSTDTVARLFRQSDPPIIGYIREGRLLFDLRTIGREEDEILISAFERIAGM